MWYLPYLTLPNLPYLEQLRYPGEALQFYTYIPGTIWIIQHLTVISVFKDFLTIYKFKDVEGGGGGAGGSLMIISELNRSAI